MMPIQAGSVLHIEGNIKGGKEISLSNGSHWTIAPEDVLVSALWIFPSPIEIAQTEEEEDLYSFLLINLHSQTAVRANPIN